MSFFMISKIILSLFAALSLTSCVNNGEDNNSSASAVISETFDFTAMMANYVDELIIPSYQNFSNEIQSFNRDSGPLATYCSSIGSTVEASERETAQIAWRSAMSTWQKSEAFLVGPVTKNGGTLRNNIYSFFSVAPLSACATDQAVVLAQASGFDISTRSFNHRGMDTLEYLLFNDNPNHNCPTQINETQNWNALPSEDRFKQRCDYAQIVAADTQHAIEDLINAWVPTGINNRSSFIDPKNLSSSFKALSDSLFYIELEVKDSKLGVPTGINSSCSQLTCAAASESQFSDTGLDNIRANLTGFRDAFTGNSGLGFDDIVLAKGFSSVSQTFLDNTNKAITLIDSMDSTLLEQLEQIEASGSATDCANSQANPESVQSIPICSLHGYLKRITDSLRTEFITIVDVDLPTRAGGDND
jgi:predicted lipoprotein